MNCPHCGQSASPWMNSQDGANYIRVPSREAFVVWARRNGIVPVRRGRRLLYLKSDLDHILTHGDRRFQIVHRRRG